MKETHYHGLEEKAEPSGKIYSVSEITAEIKQILVDSFGSIPVWINGEISNFRPRNSQGHIYFRLKDEGSVINAAFFSYANRRLSFDPEDGMQVLALGRISVYEPQGAYQIVVEELRPAGLGELHLRFEALKKKLLAEGLFDEARKRALPEIPLRIGIITSPTGAAVRDVIKVIGKRMPSTTVILFPVRVQGDEAKDDISAAIGLANRSEFDLDLLIVGRGGGSIEELMPFNEECVARAIAGSRLPVISGVGHETDFTIADFVADVRAATPSNAAELAVPDCREIKRSTDDTYSEILSSIGQKIAFLREALRGVMRSPVLRDPMVLIRTRQQMLDDLTERSAGSLSSGAERARYRLQSAYEAFVNRTRLLIKGHSGRIDSLASSLKALSPVAVLGRGYSITMDLSGKVVKSHADVETGQSLTVTLYDGGLGVRVNEKIEGKEKNKG